MSVTPLDPEPVSTHQSNADGTDIGRYGCRIEQRSATHFFDAPSAGACEPERPSGIEADMTVLVPFDLQAVVLAIDGVGDRVHRLLAVGYWLLAIGYKKPPEKSEGFLHRIS